MLVPSWHNCSALEHFCSNTFVLFYFWTKVHSFIHSHKVYWELWLLITDITIFESSDLLLYDHFSLFIESLRQLQTIVDYHYCWRLWQCLPHDWYCTFSLFHVSSYLGDPGDTDTCWVLGMSPWTELCLSVCPDALLQTFILIPHHTCGGHQLEKNSVATATQNQLSHDVTSIVCDVVVPSRGRCLDSWLSWFFKFSMFWFNHE